MAAAFVHTFHHVPHGTGVRVRSAKLSSSAQQFSGEAGSYEDRVAFSSESMVEICWNLSLQLVSQKC